MKASQSLSRPSCNVRPDRFVIRTFTGTGSSRKNWTCSITTSTLICADVENAALSKRTTVNGRILIRAV
jgi:hypothetical protein